MGQVLHLTICTLLLWIFVTSCTQKKEKKSDSISVKVEQNILTKEETPAETKQEIQSTTTELIEQDSEPELHSSANEKIEREEEQKKFKYDLSNPVKTSVLSRDLIEISALSFDVEDKILYAVNDERGVLFSLNPDSGEIIEKMKFGKKGDYEGVEIGSSGVIYAIKSNGNIVTIEKSNGASNKIKTALRVSNDVEGLGYNPNTNTLLLACKGSPNLSKLASKTKSSKSVFGWSITTQSLIEEPILTITDENLISHFLDQEKSISKSAKKKLRRRIKNFSPSGIAYNKDENLYFIISSVGKTLITINDSSEIQHIEFLDDTYFAQPEGICFGEDNALYISNEGRGLVAKLMKFEALN